MPTKARLPCFLISVMGGQSHRSILAGGSSSTSTIRPSPACSVPMVLKPSSRSKSWLFKGLFRPTSDGET